MNEFEQWTLDEVKELLYFSSTLDYFFTQQNPDLDIVNQCLTQGDFGFVTETTIVENSNGTAFGLRMIVEFYCLIEVGNEEQTAQDREIDIYLHVSERIQNPNSGIGYLPHGLQEWDFGDGEQFPLVSSDIQILDASTGLVKITQEYQLEDYRPFLAVPF